MIKSAYPTFEDKHKGNKLQLLSVSDRWVSRFGLFPYRWACCHLFVTAVAHSVRRLGILGRCMKLCTQRAWRVTKSLFGKCPFRARAPLSMHFSAISESTPFALMHARRVWCRSYIFGHSVHRHATGQVFLDHKRDVDGRGFLHALA